MDADMRTIFDEADPDRRDSQDLIAIPRKVLLFHFSKQLSLIINFQMHTKFNRKTVAKVTGLTKFAKKGFMNTNLNQQKM